MSQRQDQIQEKVNSLINTLQKLGFEFEHVKSLGMIRISGNISHIYDLDHTEYDFYQGTNRRINVMRIGDKKVLKVYNDSKYESEMVELPGEVNVYYSEGFLLVYYPIQCLREKL